MSNEAEKQIIGDADLDSPELDKAFFEQATRSIHTDALQASQHALNMHNERTGRGKQKKPTKEVTTIRLSPEVLEFFKQDGKGWQTRIDDALRDYVNQKL